MKTAEAPANLVDLISKSGSGSAAKVDPLDASKASAWLAVNAPDPDADPSPELAKVLEDVDLSTGAHDAHLIAATRLVSQAVLGECAGISTALGHLEERFTAEVSERRGTGDAAREHHRNVRSAIDHTRALGATPWSETAPFRKQLAALKEERTSRMAKEVDENLAVLNLRAIREGPRAVRIWLENFLIALGQITKITAASGAGKTILLFHMALCWSLGISALDKNEDGTPRRLDRMLRVLYIEGEVGADWVAEYLDKMAAPMDLPNLLVKNFPDWAPLTTNSGAAAFWELVDHHKPDIIILDTLSSFIDGDENDSSTWIAFDNRITLPAKARGITMVFADHTGKNAELGARGSSAKKSKLDVEWSMESSPKGSNGLLLRNLKARTGQLPEQVRLLRQDGPLGHVRSGEAAGPSGPLTFRTEAGEPVDPKVREIVAQLDELNIAPKTGLPTTAKRLRAEGLGVRDEVVRAAIAHRRARDES